MHPYTRALLSAIPVPDPTKRTHKELPKGKVPDAIHPPAGCRFHPRCPVALATCGWEGRDFLDYMEERWLEPGRAEAENVLGPIEVWVAAGLEARRALDGGNPKTFVGPIRDILEEASPPMREAVQSVAAEGEEVVVRFRPPSELRPKDLGGRTVECLLY